jgi:hypothetical protein
LILRPLRRRARAVVTTFSVPPPDGAVGTVEENAFFSYPLFERLRERGGRTSTCSG